MSDAGPGNFDKEDDIDGKSADKTAQTTPPEKSDPGEHYFNVGKRGRRATRVVMYKVNF